MEPHSNCGVRLHSRVRIPYLIRISFLPTRAHTEPIMSFIRLFGELQSDHTDGVVVVMVARLLCTLVVRVRFSATPHHLFLGETGKVCQQASKHQRFHPSPNDLQPAGCPSRSKESHFNRGVWLGLTKHSQVRILHLAHFFLLPNSRDCVNKSYSHCQAIVTSVIGADNHLLK